MTVFATLDIKFRVFGIDITRAHWQVNEDVPAELALLPSAMAFIGLLATRIAYNNHGVKLVVWVA